MKDVCHVLIAASAIGLLVLGACATPLTVGVGTANAAAADDPAIKAAIGL